MEGPINAEIQRAMEILRRRGLKFCDVSYPLIIPVFYGIDTDGVPYKKVDGHFVRNAKGDAASSYFTERSTLVKALRISGYRSDQVTLDSDLVDMVVRRIQKVGLRTLQGVQLSSVSTSDIRESKLVTAQMVDFPAPIGNAQ